MLLQLLPSGTAISERDLGGRQGWQAWEAWKGWEGLKNIRKYRFLLVFDGFLVTVNNYVNSHELADWSSTYSSWLCLLLLKFSSSQSVG